MQDMLKYLNLLSKIEDINNVKNESNSKLYNNRQLKYIYSFEYDGNLIEICLLDTFPISMPKLTLLKGKRYAHVDKKGVICLPKQEDVIYDINDGESLIVKTINSMKILFSMSQEEVEYEMLIEYNDYLSFYSNYDYTLCLLFKEETKGQFIKYQNQYILGINEKIVKRNDISKVQVKKYYMLELDNPPSLKLGNLSIKDIYDSLNEKSKKKISKWKNTNIEQFFLLKYRIPNGTDNYLFIRICNEKRHVNVFFADDVDVFIMAVRNVQMDFLRFRGGSDIYMDKILLIGCGSVGSEIAELLASSGFLNVTLVDNDFMQYENGFRNCTGFWFQNSLVEPYKVKSIAYYLSFKYPDVDYETMPVSIEELILKNEINLCEYKYIISATGNTVINCFLNDYLYKNNIEAKILFCWLEPYGIAEHILTVDTNKKGCYECYLKSTNSINLALGTESYKVRNNVCSGSFTPYGKISTVSLATEVVNKILCDMKNNDMDNCHFVKKGNTSLFLQEGFVKTKYMDYSQAEIDEKNKDFIYEGCNVCGKCDY